MAKRIQLVGHLDAAELFERYRAAADRVARCQLQIVGLLTSGKSLAEVAAARGYSTTPAGTGPRGSNRPRVSSCSSCRPTPPNSSPPNGSGRWPTRPSSTPACRPSKTSPSTSPNDVANSATTQTRSAATPSSTGGPAMPDPKDSPRSGIGDRLGNRSGPGDGYVCCNATDAATGFDEAALPLTFEPFSLDPPRADRGRLEAPSAIPSTA